MLLNLEAPPLSQLAPIVLEMLARFLALPKEHWYLPFNSRARKIVNAQYGGKISSALMSTRIGKMIDAKYVYRDEDNFLDFSPSLKKLRESSTFTINVYLDKEGNKANG